MPTSTSTTTPQPAKSPVAPAAPARVSKSKRIHKRRLKQAARKNASTPS